jgi:hypothetical protein
MGVMYLYERRDDECEVAHIAETKVRPCYGSVLGLSNNQGS